MSENEIRKQALQTLMDCQNIWREAHEKVAERLKAESEKTLATTASAMWSGIQLAATVEGNEATVGSLTMMATIRSIDLELDKREHAKECEECRVNMYGHSC